MVDLYFYENAVYFFLIPILIGVILLVQPFLQLVTKALLIRSRNRYFGRKRPKVEHFRFEDLPYIRTLHYYMDLAGLKTSPLVIIILSIFLGMLAFVVMRMVMKSFTNNLIVAIIFSSIPFLLVWQKYQIARQQRAMVMIPAVQTFTGFLTESVGSISTSIHKAADQMPFELQREWNRLCNNINMGVPLQEALLEFAERVDNEWADDFVDILISKIENGSDIVPSLFKLVNEMQNTSFNEEKRLTTMAVYRWGIFAMILLSIGIVIANITLDPKNKYYYFDDPFGRDFVTFSSVVLFASFVGALLMGRRSI